MKNKAGSNGRATSVRDSSRCLLHEGFTLIEIMIVVAMIGMLAAIATVNYKRSRQIAQKQMCICNLRHIDGAIQEWAVETRKQTGEPVTYENIRTYLREPVYCPAGGKTFSDSYEITGVDAPPVCLRVRQGEYAHIPGL